jgi:3',5'-cyclic AMP phosphodiesterase CpdA
LHFPTPNLDEEGDFKVRPDGLREALRQGPDRFLANLSHLLEPEDRPAAIVVTGDLVEKGGVDLTSGGTGEFAQAVDFLEALAGRFEIPPERVLVVPGNHDVDWTPGRSGVDRFSNYLKAVRGFSSPFERGDRLTPRTVSLQAGPDGPWAELTLLASPLFSGVADPVAKTVSDQISSLVAELPDEPRRAIQEALRSGESVLDIAALGAHQLGYIEREKPSHAEGGIRIAVLHHHLLPNPQIEVTPFESMVDAGRALEALITARYDLVLSGHKHNRALVHFGEADGSIDVYSAPSLFLSTPRSQPGFTLIDIWRPGGPHYATLREYDTWNPRRVRGEAHLIRANRVLPKVREVTAGLRPEDQRTHLVPALKSVRDAFQWRASLEAPELHKLFDRAWTQLTEDLSALGAKRLDLRPPLIVDHMRTFIGLARRVEARDGAPIIRLASENDLRYWDQAIRDPRSEAAKYSGPLREFNGSKARILVLKPPAFALDKDAELANRVIERMLGDGFSVGVVKDRQVETNVAKDFGLIADLAVWTFTLKGNEVRGLRIELDPATVRRYARDWEILNDEYCWHSDQGGSFLQHLQTSGEAG